MTATDHVGSALGRALTLTEGRAELDRTWFSWAGPLGGLVAGLCLRAGLDVLEEGQAPRSLTVLLLEAAPEGSLQLDATLVRAGGSSTVVRIDAGDAATATLVGGRTRGTSALAGVAAPDVPVPEDCPALILPTDFVPFSQHLDFRAATPARPLEGGSTAELVAWVRFADETVLDAAALTVLLDAMPPALYGATAAPVPIPTVELTVAFSDAPDGPSRSGWVLVRIATRVAAGGWAVDDSEVWDRDGWLLAQARQTRRVLGEWA